jgi:hypothetical protein
MRLFVGLSCDENQPTNQKMFSTISNFREPCVAERGFQLFSPIFQCSGFDPIPAKNVQSES